MRKKKINKAEVFFAKMENQDVTIHSPMLVTITDAEGKIVCVDDSFCQLSKYTKQELIGNTHRILNSGYHGADFFGAMWKNIKKAKTWSSEVRNKAKDGSFFWVECKIIPFPHANGKPWRYISVMKDITATKIAA